jgi:hypothetical protein
MGQSPRGDDLPKTILLIPIDTPIYWTVQILKLSVAFSLPLLLAVVDFQQIG